RRQVPGTTTVAQFAATTHDSWLDLSTEEEVGDDSYSTPRQMRGDDYCIELFAFRWASRERQRPEEAAICSVAYAFGSSFRMHFVVRASGSLFSSCRLCVAH